MRAALCVLVVFSLSFSCTLSRLAMADTPDVPVKTGMAKSGMMSMPCHSMPKPAGDDGAKKSPDQSPSDQSSGPDCCQIMCHGLVSMDVAVAAPYQHPEKLLPGAPDWPEDAEPGHDSPPPRRLV